MVMVQSFFRRDMLAGHVVQILDRIRFFLFFFTPRFGRITVSSSHLEFKTSIFSRARGPTVEVSIGFAFLSRRYCFSVEIKGCCGRNKLELYAKSILQSVRNALQGRPRTISATVISVGPQRLKHFSYLYGCSSFCERHLILASRSKVAAEEISCKFMLNRFQQVSESESTRRECHAKTSSVGPERLPNVSKARST